MKIKKLNARGFSHDVLIVLFVVIFAISGVAYIVASHADSCSPATSSATSDATSEVTSSVASSGTSEAASSCPVSDSTSEATSSSEPSATCVINGVTAKPAYGQQLSPTVTIANTGSSDIAPGYLQNLVTLSANGTQTSLVNSTSSIKSIIAPGTSTTISLSSFGPTPYSSSAAVTGRYTFTGSSPNFICSATFTLPVKPSTTPTPPVVNLPNILVQGESMAFSRDGYNLKDTNASGGAYRALYHQGNVSSTITSKGPTLTSLTVRARGTACNGASPRLTMTVDGNLVSTANLTSTSWTDYKSAFTLTRTSRTHTVVLAFVNDFATTRCDRNAYIDALTFTQRN